MSPSDWGLVGGIAGAVLGLIGGIVGTWCSIRNTAGKRERALMVRLAAGFWAAMAVLGAAAWVIPAPFKVLAFVPVWFAVPFLIPYWNRKQREFRGSGDGRE